jgi:hypothetical protein
LLDEFEELRRENLDNLRTLALTRQDLSRQGRHPSFGRVTLHELLSTWVVHDMDHIWQIVRTMSGRYRDDVGPWRAFLSILHPRDKQEVQDIANELVDMARSDLDLRTKLVDDGTLFDGYHEDMRHLHHRNTRRLAEIVAIYGWPRATLFGTEASEAAWLILQHSVDQPEFIRSCLPMLEQAARIGEASLRHMAMTTDRLMVMDGQPQVYGTQFDWDESGELSPLPIADENSVEERRAAVGLPSITVDLERIRAEAKREGETAH